MTREEFIAKLSEGNDQITKLHAQIGEITRDLRKYRDEYHTSEDIKFRKKWGVTVGDVIEITTKRGIIRNGAYSGIMCEKAWSNLDCSSIRLYKLKKNGEPSQVLDAEGYAIETSDIVDVKIIK